MDYVKMHDKFIEHFNNSKPRDRLLGRNSNDDRLTFRELYTESHHIIPKHSGGLDIQENLVDLLPEEHLFIHMLRYKAFNNKDDFLTVRFILNGIDKHTRYDKFRKHLTKRIRSTYAILKSSTYRFKMIHGWQSEDGRKRISDARKNTFPAKEKSTNKPIGSVRTDHPKVLSGEWVHHSYGNHSYTNMITGEKIYCSTDDSRLNDNWIANNPSMKGEKNTRYSGITDDELENFIYKLSKACKDLYNKSTIPPMSLIHKVWNLKYNTKFPDLGAMKSGFRFGGDKTKIYKRSVHELNLIHDKRQKYYDRNINIEELLNAID